MIKEPTLMICKKSCVDADGDGVAKGGEYWVISYDSDSYLVFDNKENCSSSKAYKRFTVPFYYGKTKIKTHIGTYYGYVGKIPANKFMTLAEFRDFRMGSILDDE